jgi:DNA-binding transcriptional LysR family regulator
MVGAHMGVFMIPEMAVDKSTPGRFIPIDDPHATCKLGAVLLRARFRPRAHRTLLAHLRGNQPSCANT